MSDFHDQLRMANPRVRNEWHASGNLALGNHSQFIISRAKTENWPWFNSAVLQMGGGVA